MNKEKSPAFQFYPKDFLTDGKVICMSAEEVGYYIKLLCIDWLEDGFPKDCLLRLVGYDFYDDVDDDGNKKSSKILATLETCFVNHPIKHGFLTNPRLQKERKKQHDRSVVASVNGANGGKSKQRNRLHEVANARVLLRNSSSKSVANSSSSSSSSTPVTSSLRSDSIQTTNPTLQECKDYFILKGSSSVEAEKFFYYYDSKQWLVGKAKMKNWKSAISGWILRSDKADPKNPMNLNKKQQQNMEALNDFARRHNSDTRLIS